MTELQLYKFIERCGCEWHWEPDGHLVLFIASQDLKGFCGMSGYDAFDDGGLPCEQHLCYNGSVALSPFEDVCEHYGIESENVFPKNEEQ